MPEFEFTLFLEGFDVLSDEVQDRIEHLAVPFPIGTGEPRPGITRRSLRYRGGDFFENALFGEEGSVQYATFRLEVDDEATGMQWAAAMLTHAVPGLRVTGAQPGRYGSVEIL
jgi:hypothetical protein